MVITEAKRRPNQPRRPIPIRVKQSTNEIIITAEHCLQCGTCASTCPARAIHVVNILDEDRDKNVVHVYPPVDRGSDSTGEGFRLHGLPVLSSGTVVGLCGPNGIGKSTVLNILAGSLVPNFGRVEDGACTAATRIDQVSLLDQVKDNAMREHFKALGSGRRTIAHKQQVLSILFDAFAGRTVGEILAERAGSLPAPFREALFTALAIAPIAGRHLEQCSGGELQRFAIALVLATDADVYLVDEPCTFLDVKKRVALARLLGTRARTNARGDPPSVLVVEHDLALLDYLSDAIHLFYGVPHEFGVVTSLQSPRAAINSYLEGYLKAENLRFRDNAISFKRTVGGRRWDNARVFASYGAISKTYDAFHLDIVPGTVYMSEILCVVGENGLGKTTFARIVSGLEKPDPGSTFVPVASTVAYKPQYITKAFDGTVQAFISAKSGSYDFSEQALSVLYRPLGVDVLLEKPVAELSGGELQRAFLCACLATRADLYVIDEPSAYLDVEERLKVSSVIRAMTKRTHATTICVEHDIQIADALADRILLFTGEPGVRGVASGPLDKKDGMNAFLEELDLTFRRDEDTGRARINKKGSKKDVAQRAAGEHFYDG